MASLIRFGVSRFISPNGKKGLLISTKELNFVRHITGKTVKGDTKIHKPPPYPYNEKSYGMWRFFLDRTTSRFDDNTKLLVVEGPVAAGKSCFAKDLATELEMLYMPEANLDMIYFNSYGYDLRLLDEQLPESCRSFDVNNFLINPKHMHSTRFQIEQYIVKYSQYVDALAHILSTGQGVVLDRCVYSDFVFAEAMRSQSYISKAALKYYYDIRDNSIEELLKPNLIIYLDVPVNKTLENIKKRNVPYEKNSPVLSKEYLSIMEKFYKQSYLKEMSKHAELLVYDWSEGGDIEVVVEDIERIKFEYDIQDPKGKDWYHSTEEDWAVLRQKYSDKKENLMSYTTNVPGYHIPEIIIEAEDGKLYHEIMDSAPGETYEKGYNIGLGDSGILLKTKGPGRDTLPLRERRPPAPL